MKHLRFHFGLLCAVAFAVPATADQLSEGFTSIPALSGSGWSLINNSAPATQSWYQGNDGIFPAQAGPTDSYIGADFLTNGGNGGDISLWLLTPVVTLTNGITLNFWTRGGNEPGFPDQLEVRYSTNGSSANVGSTTSSVGDFTNLALTVNPVLSADAYPTAWTLFSAVVSGVSSPVTGRFAFRYTIPDSSTNGNYIGIDTVSVSDVAAVPLPASFWLLLSGLAGMVALQRRRLALDA